VSQLHVAKETECELGLKFTDVDITWFVCTPAFFSKVLFSEAVQIELLTDREKDVHLIAASEPADNMNAADECTDKSTKFICKLGCTMGKKVRRLLLLKDDVGRDTVSVLLKLLSTEPSALRKVILHEHYREGLDCASAILRRFNVTFYCDLSSITHMREPEIFSPPALRRKAPELNEVVLAKHASRQREGYRRFVSRAQISEAAPEFNDNVLAKHASRQREADCRFVSRSQISEARKAGPWHNKGNRLAWLWRHVARGRATDVNVNAR
jgi:hypothetical protein